MSLATVSAFLVGCESPPVLLDPSRTISDAHGILQMTLASDWIDSTDSAENTMKSVKPKTTPLDPGVRILRKLRVPKGESFCRFSAFRYTSGESNYHWSEVQLAHAVDKSTIHSFLNDDIGSILDRGEPINALYRKADRAEKVGARLFTTAGLPSQPATTRNGWMVESKIWFDGLKLVNLTLAIPYKDKSLFSKHEPKNYLVAECAIQGNGYIARIRMQEVNAMLSSISLK